MQTALAPGLEISKIITGLWQIADIERKQEIDPKIFSRTIDPYVEAGFTTFDMADHYGSSELIIGHFNEQSADSNIQLFTKWVPKPGSLSREITKEAVHLALRRLNKSSIDLSIFNVKLSNSAVNCMQSFSFIFFSFLDLI